MRHHESSMLDIGTVFATSAEKTGGIISAAMIASPLWLQHIQSISDVAAIFAPILGCIYLSLQIGFKLWDRTRNDE